MTEPDTVEEIYEHIAGVLAAAVDEPWHEIRLNAEVWTTSTGFTGDYTRDPPDGGIADLDVDRIDYSVVKALKKLRTIMASTAHEPWNRATFKLAPDGEFSVNFVYDRDLAARLDDAAAQVRARSGR
jgi:hypothetical protein